MNKKNNRIWTLALVGLLGISCSLPVRAAEQRNEQAIQQEAIRSGDEEGISAAFLYAELSEDGTKQNVVIKLDFEGNLDSAVLFSDASGVQEETDAYQIIDNYASFSLPVSENRTFLKIEFSVNGTGYTTSLLPLENGTQIEQEDFQDAVSAQPSVAAFSLDDESSDDVDGSVITSTLDERISAQELAESVAATLTLQTGNSATETSQEDGKKVIVLDPGHGRAGTGTYRDWGDFIIDEAIINYKITTYTKEALEANYANIAVYTTKISQNENPSLEKRVQYAVAKDADIFVSQHVNATGEEITKASGVLAMVPKLDASHDYNHDAAQASLDMAAAILKELESLNFKNIGFQERLTENGSKYPDGSYADYYGIVKHCRENELPGAIIEHGFANNREDAIKLNNENMLKKIGEADAKGIASYLKLSSGTSVSPEDNTGVLGHTFSDNSSSDKTGWQKINNQWYYYDSKGKATTGWQKINGAWYYMNKDGVMQTGWLEIDGKKYYLSSNGAMVTGWLQLDNKWYYFSGSGAMLTGWQKIGSKWYYLDLTSGIMAADTWIGTYYVDANGAWIEGKKQTDSSSTDSSSTTVSSGWIRSGSRWWYRHKDGTYTRNGWEKINGVWYLFDSDGWMLTGWQKVKGTWYYLNTSGAMVAGWLQLDGKWYYLNGSGAMLTGWQKIGSKWYYLNSPSGVMAADTWIGTYYVDASGAWVEGKKQTGETSVSDSVGSSEESKWIRSGNRWWYRHGDGSYTRNGWEKIDGVWYLFDDAGWMLTGWQKVNGTWYYMNTSGAMVTGWQKIGGTWYYMNTSGAMLTGWQTIDGVKYYLDKSGAMLTGTHTIDGETYTFKTSGALAA